MLNKHATEEQKGGNEVFYHQPIACIATEDLPDYPYCHYKTFHF